MQELKTLLYSLAFYSDCYFMQLHSVTDQHLSTQFYIPLFSGCCYCYQTKKLPTNLNLSFFSNQIHIANLNL